MNKERQGGIANAMLAESFSVKPILFSTPMVEAIEAGRKTQTRRLVKFPKDFDGKEVYQNGVFGLKYTSNEFEGCIRRLYPKYEIGDILWVRETWRPIEQDFGNPRYEYKATEKVNISDKWKPSLFMPKAACRLFLKVKSVGVERLQDISHEDAVAEGIEYIDIEEPFTMGYKLYGKHRIPELLGRKAETGTSIESYQTLWESINGRESWDSNPYVWVVSFELTGRPQGFC